jgi:DNA-binding NarL/FixJ family response regulator
MLRILLAEKKTPFRNALQQLLQNRFPNANITAVDSCKDAEEMIASLVPDLVFINIHLSSGKGFEVVRKTKTPTITFLALADYDLPEYHVASRRSGADYFVPKDQWSGEKMLALVDTILMEADTDG